MAKPKTVTIYGRLSYPVFTYAEALKRNPGSKFPKADPADVAPEFNLLVEQPQLDKLIAHLQQEFLPYCLDQQAKGEKRDALDSKQVDKINKLLDAADWESQPPYISIKQISDKTAALAPECVASIKIGGNKGTDIELKAIVNDESELSVPDPAVTVFPIIRPIGQTMHSMYGGAYVAATLNLYAFVSGALPGFSASASVAVFKADGDRFGGGAAVDEDEMFLD
jgi:hypothetical protein